MNLGELIYSKLGSSESTTEYLPMLFSVIVPIYFQKLFYQYSPQAVAGLEKEIDKGGFFYEGEVNGPLYSYPMAGVDYSILVGVTPPISPLEVEKAMHDPSGFWAPLFEMIGKYIIKCKISFCNLTSGLSVPIVIGWDETSKAAQPLNRSWLETTEKSIPNTWRTVGETFTTAIKLMQLSDTKEIWDLFGEYVNKLILATMSWTVQLQTLKNPTLLNPGLPGTMTGTLLVSFTKLP